MPIYGYQCQACSHDFEVMQKVSDPAPQACPACGRAEVRKLLTAAGIQLKGKGWYATDFKGGAAPTGDKDGGGSEPGPAAGGCGSGTCGCH
jgi:putative FmdB family regulatory protein